MLKFCSLYSGSSGNAIFLRHDDTGLLIDAGLSAKRIVEALAAIDEKPDVLSAILVSHEHSDHIRGVGILSRRFNIPIYANENTWEAMEPFLGPVDAANKAYFNTGETFSIDNVLVNTFQVPHDACEPVGYSFFADEKKITIATDIGHISPGLLSCLEGSDLLLLESNHDAEMLKVGRYPWHLKQRIAGDRGHLSNDAAGEVIAGMAERGMKRFLLGHLSRENNFPELAYRTVYNALSEKSIQAGIDVMLDVALRDRVGRVIEL